MLMFQNALMYNNCEHDVYKMTQDMQKDVMDQVEVSKKLHIIISKSLLRSMAG